MESYLSMVFEYEMVFYEKYTNRRRWETQMGLWRSPPSVWRSPPSVWTVEIFKIWVAQVPTAQPLSPLRGDEIFGGLILVSK